MNPELGTPKVDVSIPYRCNETFITTKAPACTCHVSIPYRCNETTHDIARRHGINIRFNSL